MAGALSTVLVMVTLLLTVLQKLWVERKNYAMSSLRRLAYPRLDCGESGSTLRFLIPFALAVLLAAVVLVLILGLQWLWGRGEKP